MGTENTKFKIGATTSDGDRQKCDLKGAPRALLNFSHFVFKLNGAFLSSDYLILGILDVWNISLKTSQGCGPFMERKEMREIYTLISKVLLPPSSIMVSVLFTWYVQDKSSYII